MQDGLGSLPALCADTFSAAFEEWRQVLGRDFVVADDGALASLARSTSASPVLPAGVLRPGSAEEVVAAVRIARRHRIPLYPISRGRNWGYGDACPVASGQVVVDLGRLDRIIEINEELAYAVIEPGVTQGQLADYLAEHHPGLWADCTGAGPDVSIVGNFLERGFGHSAYGNRFQSICGMEIVRADGRFLKTGYGHYDNAKAARSYPYGIGPALDGLFTQANFGIVTSLGFWLLPAPERFSVFACSVRDDGDLGELIERVRTLRLNGTLRSVVHIGNDMRVISSGMAFPAGDVAGTGPLPPDFRAALGRRLGVGRWTAVGSLAGSRAQVRAGKRDVSAALRKYQIQFVDNAKLRLGRRVAGIVARLGFGRKLEAKIETAEAVFNLNRGRPTRRFLAGAYWRHKDGIPPKLQESADPRADGCGFFWISPMLPATGRDATALCRLVEPMLAQHGFDFFVTFSFVNERSLAAVITLAFDASDAQETERARQCYRSVFEAVMRAGYIPYRVGTYSMPDIADPDDSYWQTVRELKSALDPDGIIAPGRYDPMAR